MGLRSTDSLAVLEALSPEPGWETTLALISSYSVDLVAAAALVVALAGEGDDPERMGHATLARACERMHNRFRVICQAGRVIVPTKLSQDALVLSDRWIREVHRDGNVNSWHAKLALVRYERVDAPGTHSWRLWVGSRNLTRDVSWDSALLAVGRPGNGDAISQSIARAGLRLARYADLPDAAPSKIEEALRHVEWSWPEGDVLRVRSLELWTGDADRRTLPTAPRGLQRLIAISPFADGGTLAALGKMGGAKTQRWLLTSRATLDKVARQKQTPLRGFEQLLSMDRAASEEGVQDHEVGDDEQLAEVHRGLHAKLLLMETQRRHTLWLGSANLTTRAWGGGNAEVMLELEVTPNVTEGLIDGFIKSFGEIVERDALGAKPEDEDEVEAHLDGLRNRIAAAWEAARLVAEDPHLCCVVGTPPIGKSDKATLSVGLLGQALRPWPMNATQVAFPKPRLRHMTEWMVLTLRSEKHPTRRVEWVARVVMDPPPPIERDRAVLSRLMGARAFLAWLRTLLGEVTGEPPDPHWPPRNPAQSQRRPRARRGALGAPTLEAILRTWARDPNAVTRVDRAVQTWAAEIRAACQEPQEPDEQAALDELRAFEESWEVLRVGLQLPSEDR